MTMPVTDKWAPWSHRRMEKLGRLHARGLRLEDIADAMGTNIRAVKYQLEVLDRRPVSSTRLTRKCLGCREPFQSDWIGNRLCKRCHASVGRVDIRERARP